MGITAGDQCALDRRLPRQSSAFHGRKKTNTLIIRAPSTVF